MPDIEREIFDFVEIWKKEMSILLENHFCNTANKSTNGIMQDFIEKMAKNYKDQLINIKNMQEEKCYSTKTQNPKILSIDSSKIEQTSRKINDIAAKMLTSITRVQQQYLQKIFQKINTYYLITSIPSENSKEKDLQNIFLSTQSYTKEICEIILQTGDKINEQLRLFFNV